MRQVPSVKSQKIVPRLLSGSVARMCMHLSRNKRRSFLGKANDSAVYLRISWILSSESMKKKARESGGRKIILLASRWPCGQWERHF